MTTPEERSKVFIDYDTDNGLYKLPRKGKMLMLLFQGNNGLFTTIRSAWPTKKVEYYKKNIGNIFDIVIT